MSATTIKIEDPLLKEIQKAKPEGQSISFYVKKAVENEIRRKKMAEAADQYQALLDANSAEAVSLKDWESASLDQPIKTKR